MTKQQVLDRVRELVPHTKSHSCERGEKCKHYRCDEELFSHHLLEAVRRADVTCAVRITGRGHLRVYLGDGVNYEGFIPLLSPLEDWDRVPGPDGKMMASEEAERMWGLLARALGI